QENDSGHHDGDGAGNPDWISVTRGDRKRVSRYASKNQYDPNQNGTPSKSLRRAVAPAHQLWSERARSKREINHKQPIPYDTRIIQRAPHHRSKVCSGIQKNMCRDSNSINTAELSKRRGFPT